MNPEALEALIEAGYALRDAERECDAYFVKEALGEEDVNPDVFNAANRRREDAIARICEILEHDPLPRKTA